MTEAARIIFEVRHTEVLAATYYNKCYLCLFQTVAYTKVNTETNRDIDM
jgi:hypothetical protein